MRPAPKSPMRNRPGDNGTQKYVPFLKDRVQLSEVAIEASASQEPILNVHKRNPHTTYLSQIESFIDMINTVAVAQETAKAQEAEAANALPAKLAPKQATKSGSKTGNRTTGMKTLKPMVPMMRQPGASPSRSLPSGPITLK